MAPSNSRSKADTLRILCFGNSLTAGYPAGNPYAVKLAEKIEKECPGRKVEFDVEGLPGDLVTTGQFIERMASAWTIAEKPYDWTIVLGGTNDLGWGRTSEAIIEGLKRTWGIPLSRGGKVLSLTVPETKGKFQSITQKRNEVNDAIRSYERTRFFHFDLFKAVPYHGMEPEDRARYWEPDGVHLSEAGYDYMGEKVGEALVRILKLAEAVDDDIGGVAMTARQRKAIEELIFEEEMGDPKMLSQGYIVVRRKDLD
ncbi:GDSL-like Lipase/Acylhydrolase [Xylariaceae sp. FL1019]|nr:GDSL-like Lipase/Acylhydrolase [Xylariaceae sp. FL1019]